MYQYQTTNRYFAQVADDIKDIAEQEVQNFGGKDIHRAYRGLYFTCTQDELYQINLCSRLLNRIIAPLLAFNCHSDRYLYKQVYQIAWDDFISPTHTFAVFASVSHSNIRHSKYAALRCKDAIVDYFKDKTGKRPSIDTHDPDLWINLHIENNNATLGIDTSGGSLHRRGYRKSSVAAPMVETLAAALIEYSEWDAQTPLYDPFCGSGTILYEAFLKATNTPPSLNRKKFGFEMLPDFNSTKWNEIKKVVSSQIIQDVSGLIYGSDKDHTAVKAARVNKSSIDLHNMIELNKSDIFDIPRLENVTIVTNPPYGVRLNKREDLSDFYKNLGDFLKQQCTGSTAFIYFGDRQYIKKIGLRASWKKKLSNGGLDGRFARYDLY